MQKVVIRSLAELPENCPRCGAARLEWSRFTTTQTPSGKPEVWFRASCGRLGSHSDLRALHGSCSWGMQATAAEEDEGGGMTAFTSIKLTDYLGQLPQEHTIESLEYALERAYAEKELTGSDLATVCHALTLALQHARAAVHPAIPVLTEED